MTWGHPDYGGDSSAVQDQLVNVRQIQASSGAFGGSFAAIRSVGQSSAGDVMLDLSKPTIFQLWITVLIPKSKSPW